jgi:hypothetical protein
VSEQIEDMKTQAYKLTGSAMENLDLMAQAIDAGDWETASDLASVTSQVMCDQARF